MEQKERVVGVRMSDGVRERLAELARARGITVSELIRQAADLVVDGSQGVHRRFLDAGNEVRPHRFLFDRTEYYASYRWPAAGETAPCSRDGRPLQRDETLVCLIHVEDGRGFARTARVATSGTVAALLRAQGLMDRNAILQVYLERLPDLMVLDNPDENTWPGILRTPEGAWFNFCFVAATGIVERVKAIVGERATGYKTETRTGMGIVSEAVGKIATELGETVALQWSLGEQGFVRGTKTLWIGRGGLSATITVSDEDLDDCMEDARVRTRLIRTIRTSVTELLARRNGLKPADARETGERE